MVATGFSVLPAGPRSSLAVPEGSSPLARAASSGFAARAARRRERESSRGSGTAAREGAACGAAVLAIL